MNTRTIFAVLSFFAFVRCLSAQSGVFTVSYGGGTSDSVNATITVSPGDSPGTWKATVSASGSAAIPQARFSPVSPTGSLYGYTTSTTSWPIADWPAIMIQARSQTSGGSAEAGPYTLGSGTNPPFRDVTFTATNDTDKPILYAVGLSDAPGVVLKDSTQWVEAGDSYSYTVSLADGDDSTYTAVVVDYVASFAGGDVFVYNGVDSSGALTGVEWLDMVGTPVGSSKGFSDGVDATEPSSVIPRDGAASSTRQNVPSTTVSPVTVTAQASGVTVTSNTNTSSDALKGSEFGKGIDRIVNKLEDVRRAVVASGTGGSSPDPIDLSGVEDRLDTANDHLSGVQDGLDAANDNLSGIQDRLDTANDHLATISDPFSKAGDFDQEAALSQAQTAAAGVSDYSGVRPVLGAPDLTFGGGDGEFGSIVVGNQTVTFGIMTGIAGTDGLMRALRPALLAAMCIGFLRGISGHVTTYTASLPQVQAQDTAFGIENVVPGVAQAKTYGTAAAAVVVIFGGAAAIVVLADTLVTYYGGGIGGMLSSISMPAGMAVGVMDQYVPLAAGMGLTILSSAAPYLMAPVYLSTAAVLRFLKT